MALSARQAAGALVSLAAVIAVALLLALTVMRADLRPRTDDSYLVADLVHLAPDVSGRIVELDVQDNQRVQRGQLLFRIDPGPYQLHVDQARASMLGLQAKLALSGNQVSAQTSTAHSANKAIAAANAQLALASLTLSRLEPLLPHGYVTAQQVDQARTARQTAEIALSQAQSQASAAVQAISDTKPVEEEFEAAKATLALAERDLSLTDMRAPCDGVITALDVAAGEFAITGKPVFTIIDTEHWWAVGNFRETDLRRIQPGQKATVFVMQDPAAPVAGVVDSVGSGVAPDEGITFGGLPHVPRSLNWVRIAQRFPVRVLLTNPPKALMRVGASTVIVINR